MKAIGYFLMVALIIWLVAQYAGGLFGITISGENTYVSALIFAVILSLINLILGTIFRFITLPLNILTFGFVSFLISLFLIYITDEFYESISIEGVLGYLIMAFIPGIASLLVGKK